MSVNQVTDSSSFQRIPGVPYGFLKCFTIANKGQFSSFAATNNRFEYLAISLVACYHAENCFLHDTAVARRLLLYFTESQIHMALYFIPNWAAS